MIGAIMLDWLWLLLPAAAAGGWLSARGGGGRARRRSLNEYLKGLNFLINDRRDEALDHLIALFEVGPGTVETHLTLGNLFRQKGELDSATRVHHNLLKKLAHNDPKCAEVLIELGRDYSNAGLFDRAEQAFKRALKIGGRETRGIAHRNLLKLYEMEKDWENAVVTSRALEKLSGEKLGARMAHYYCELAETARAKGDLQGALRWLGQQRRADRGALRGLILEGDIEYARGNRSGALARWTRAFIGHPKHAPLLLPRLQRALGDQSGPDFVDYIGGLRPEDMSAYYVVEYSKALLAANRIGEVKRLFEQLAHCRRLPDTLACALLDRLLAADGAPDANAGIAAALESDAIAKTSYRCNACGFESVRHSWQCPGCHQWDSAVPE